MAIDTTTERETPGAMRRAGDLARAFDGVYVSVIHDLDNSAQVLRPIFEESGTPGDFMSATERLPVEDGDGDE